MLPAGHGMLDLCAGGGRTIDRSIDKSIDLSVTPAPGGAARRRSGGVLRKLLNSPAAPPPRPAAAAAPSLLRPTGSLDRLRSQMDRASSQSPEQASPAPVDELTSLLQTQTAAGAFGWDGDRERLAVEKVPGWAAACEWLEQEAATRSAGHPDAAAAVATAKGLLLLARGFAADRAIWSRAAEKAVRFLAAVVKQTPAEVTAWLAGV